jgi:hypothetical protein
MIQDLKIADIRLDGNTQARVAIHQTTVDEYAEVLTAGGELPPVVVYFDGAAHWLADGFHRLHAHRSISAVTVRADVRDGTAREAQMHAYGANQAHGLRRTNDDKRKAVLGMLALVPDWSDRAIAKHVGVAHTMVAAVRNPEVQERQKDARQKTTKAEGVESDSTPGLTGSNLPAAEPPARKADREPGPVRSSTEAPAPNDPDTGDFDPVAELQTQMAINAGLQEQIKAAEADDLKAEVMKWRRAYEHAQRTADDKMANAARLDKELQQLHNRMLRIGKLFGERDPAKIPALVESFYRAHAKVAA